MSLLLRFIILRGLSTAPGSATWLQIQLPIGGDMGGLGVTSQLAVSPAAHAASVEASLGLLRLISPALAVGFELPLPPSASGLLLPSSTPLLPSVVLWRRALVALPAASYHLLSGGALLIDFSDRWLSGYRHHLIIGSTN